MDNFRTGIWITLLCMHKQAYAPRLTSWHVHDRKMTCKHSSSSRIFIFDQHTITWTVRYWCMYMHTGVHIKYTRRFKHTLFIHTKNMRTCAWWGWNCATKICYLQTENVHDTRKVLWTPMHTRCYTCRRPHMSSGSETHTQMHLCMYACMYVCMYACMYACMYVYAWLRYLHACSDERITYVHMHVHTYKNIRICWDIKGWSLHRHWSTLLRARGLLKVDLSTG